jgi:hypothetical protein
VPRETGWLVIGAPCLKELAVVAYVGHAVEFGRRRR